MLFSRFKEIIGESLETLKKNDTDREDKPFGEWLSDLDENNILTAEEDAENFEEDDPDDADPESDLDEIDDGFDED